VFEKREVAHWKANHANRVEAARVLIERLIGDPKREALLAEAVDLLKWMNDNGRLLCDGSIRWRAQEVIKTYEG
jgi:hypothetical protein